MPATGAVRHILPDTLGYLLTQANPQDGSRIGQNSTGQFFVCDKDAFRSDYIHQSGRRSFFLKFNFPSDKYNPSKVSKEPVKATQVISSCKMIADATTAMTGIR